MEIILGKTAGFCNGITRAVETAKEELKNAEEVECLGDLLHNNQVLNNLKANGLRIITDIREAKERVIIRAHGVKKEVYEYAKKNNIKKAADIASAAFLWRRGWDSNPWPVAGSPVFKTGSLNHSDISPGIAFVL